MAAGDARHMSLTLSDSPRPLTFSLLTTLNQFTISSHTACACQGEVPYTVIYMTRFRYKTCKNCRRV